MQHKWMVLFTTLVLLSLLMAPSGMAQAQRDAQRTAPDCPHLDTNLLKDKSFLHSLPPDCIKTYKEFATKANSATNIQNTQPMTVSGPDSFGYIYDDTVGYGWISASTNSGLIGDDEFTGPIDIGFNFPFYGIPQSQLYVSTNGLITFGAGNSDYAATSLPFEFTPNNLIAPFWSDLVVGGSSNSGAMYYSRGGSAPNRYFVMEWRNVEEVDACSSPIFTFEAILYEKGDIVVQYQSLPDCYPANVGIEDSLGSEGSEYLGSLSFHKAICFYYPTASSARLLVSPLLHDGAFAPITGYKDFPITVINPGTFGADTYDLTHSSSWPVAFYASNGVTPLTDTDGDNLFDTGSIAQGTSAIVIARVSTPGGAQIGDQNTATVTVTSSLNASKTKTIDLFTSIPANFTSVFNDRENGAMSFMAADLHETNTSKVTSDDYPGYDVAMTKLEGNNYFYTWAKRYFNGSYWQFDIEYTILSRTGNRILPLTRLTNNSSMPVRVWDRFPSVTMAPNGTIGIVWRRDIYDPSISKSNENIYFAILNKSGSLLSGPINITNNTVWSTSSDLNVARFYDITLAASDDNRFVIGWGDYRYIGNAYNFNVGYAIRDANGASIVSPLSLAPTDMSLEPVLNGLTGGKVILTWRTTPGQLQYLIINSNGTTGPSGGLSMDAAGISDAVQLPNGKVAVAWPTNAGVGFAILSSSYAVEHNVTANTPSPNPADALSVTTDASSHVIMTWAYSWALGDGADNKLFYALGDSTGAFITFPVLYKKSTNFIANSYNGQGNAPYEFGGSTMSVKIGNSGMGSYWLVPQESQRKSYLSMNNGPVKIFNTDDVASIAAERVIYKVSGVNTSFSEMMGLPNNQLDTVYWLPWYNNADLDTQLRFGNVDPNLTATVRIWIGGKEISGCNPTNVPYPYLLDPGQSLRVSCPSINNGPVKIQSNVPIVAAERVVYRVNGLNTSFSEMMALPNSQLDNTYWLPWYNNTELDTQLRFGNVSNTNQTATVQVYIHGQEISSSCTPKGPYSLAAGASLRVSCPGVNNGPVKIESTQPIVTAERVTYKVNNLNTSFTEMMALPNSQLDTTYWLPWYNNANLDTQLRFGNVDPNPTATVHVKIGGVEVTGCTPHNSPFTLLPGESVRVSCAGLNNGPVQIDSIVPIVAAERVVYKVNNLNTSFTEMMALPNNQLDSIYWLPWYNNVDLDTQLRFGVP